MIPGNTVTISSGISITLGKPFSPTLQPNSLHSSVQHSLPSSSNILAPVPIRFQPPVCDSSLASKYLPTMDLSSPVPLVPRFCPLSPAALSGFKHYAASEGTTLNHFNYELSSSATQPCTSLEQTQRQELSFAPRSSDLLYASGFESSPHSEPSGLSDSEGTASISSTSVGFGTSHGRKKQRRYRCVCNI